MHEIVSREELAPNTYRIRVHAPLIAEKRRAGQFIILMTHATSERVPLTLVDSDTEEGTITLVFQAVGKSTLELAALNVGDSIAELAGPLGRPTHIDIYGTCVVVGGGYGIAPVVPIARALAEAGNRVIAVNGARTAEAVILTDALEEFCEEVIICTDDGTLGRPGFVTEALRELIEGDTAVDFVLAVGPSPMMKAVAELTRPHAIPTMVSLNPIMVDGTGMCGGCRVEVGGETKFACVDGPEFDGHKVNFDLLMARQQVYRDVEGEAKTCYEDSCRLDEAAGKKQRLPRVKMPEQDPAQRAHNFNEVALGYDEEQAVAEASRCLECAKPKCVAGCPVQVQIPEFIRLIKERDFIGAARTIKETNALPSICGRVCPQEIQCEAVCVLARTPEGPVAVGNLERFVADYERENAPMEADRLAPPSGKRVAVVGSGPAGLVAAADLARLGHQPVVLEALHELGGVLVYGIPEFRLPKAIVRHDVDYLRALGVEFQTSHVVGKTQTIEELAKEYDAVFIGTGAGLPSFLGIPGENLIGVFSANEYLTRVNLMKAYDKRFDTPIIRGKHVMTVGGGNVAMDSARTALRMGAEKSYIVYRRTMDEIPARRDEVHHAIDEGIEFMLLSLPVALLGDEKQRLQAAVIQKMELGEPDADGRRRPVPIEGSEFELPIDLAIIAIGTGPNPIVTDSMPDLATRNPGYIVVDEETGATNIPGVYAGGDIVTGAATVIEAMGAGRRAATAIDAYLRGNG